MCSIHTLYECILFPIITIAYTFFYNVKISIVSYTSTRTSIAAVAASTLIEKGTYYFRSEYLSIKDFKNTKKILFMPPSFGISHNAQALANNQ